MKYLVKQLKGTKATAEALGISQRTVERYVAGKLKRPRQDLRGRTEREVKKRWQPQGQAKARKKAALAAAWPHRWPGRTGPRVASQLPHRLPRPHQRRPHTTRADRPVRLGELLSAVHPRGTEVSLGFTGGKQAELDIVDLLMGEKHLTTYAVHNESEEAIARG
ncbi:hypothetical protein ABT174_21120 [Streptomyces sparsogenes]